MAAESCLKCRGFRWFDDLGFVAAGQVAFQFVPCDQCNPKGELGSWGEEIGDFWPCEGPKLCQICFEAATYCVLITPTECRFTCEEHVKSLELPNK